MATAFRTRSLWALRAGSKRSFPALSGKDQRYDVAVVGGGIAGLLCVMRLKEQGKKVALLEAREVGSGVTGNTTAKLTSLHGLCYADIEAMHGPAAARTYAEMNEGGLHLISSYVEKLGVKCDFERMPAVTYTERDDMVDKVRQEANAAERAGLKATFVKDIGLPVAVKGAVSVQEQAQFNPLPFCHALANAIDGGGSAVFENARVENVSLAAPHTVDMVAGGRMQAQHVVVATHLPILDRSNHFAVVKPSSSYLVAFELSDDSKLPRCMPITAESPKHSLRSAVAEDGKRVLIAGGWEHHTGEQIDTRERYDAIEAWTREHFPVKRVHSRWSALDYMPPDMLPYIGYLHRGTSTVFTATGFKKWGFTAAGGAAIIISDLVAGRANPWHDMFDARRWNLSKTAGKVAAVQLEVGKHLVGDRIHHLATARDVHVLQNDEGGICKLGGKVVAAYKDESGALTALDPACQHLGCHVNWNSAERTWDCPCHGSRYDTSGEVLHGPSVKPLKKVQTTSA